MNVLFVCSMARLRSRTASTCFPGTSDYAGTDADADKPITKALTDWADKIVCMETRHRSKVRRKFKGLSHKIEVWSIPDDYGFLDKDLVTILERKFESL